MFTPTKHSPVVDQYMRSVADSDRRARVPRAHCVLPWYIIENDVRMEGLILSVRSTPLRERYDPKTDMFIESPADGRGYVRTVAMPHVGHAVDAGDRGSHVKLARSLVGGYTECDRCGRNDRDREIALVDMPPNYLAIVLCGDCLDEIGAGSYSMLP